MIYSGDNLDYNTIFYDLIDIEFLAKIFIIFAYLPERLPCCSRSKIQIINLKL